MMMMMMMGVHTECGLHLSVNRNLENNKHTWLNIIEYDIYYAIHSSRAIWYFSWVSINTFSAATFTEMLLLIASLPIILTPRIWTMPSFWRFILMANSDVWTRFKSPKTASQAVFRPFEYRFNVHIRTEFLSQISITSDLRLWVFSWSSWYFFCNRIIRT